jgi:hypothetical protein
MTDWATPDDVSGLTGVSVSVADIERAQPIIELFSDATTDASDAGMISTRNLRLLKWALCYQAVWMKDQPDLFTHTDTEGVSQDGVSANYSHANAALLAPLARRCISRLGWKLRPAQIQPPRPRPGHGFQPDFGSLDDAVADDDRVDWVPYRT